MVEKTIIDKIKMLNEGIEVLKEKGDKRIVRRTSFSKGKNNKAYIDYCIQKKIKLKNGLERWGIEYSTVQEN